MILCNMCLCSFGFMLYVRDFRGASGLNHHRVHCLKVGGCRSNSSWRGVDYYHHKYSSTEWKSWNVFGIPPYLFTKHTNVPITRRNKYYFKCNTHTYWEVLLVMVNTFSNISSSTILKTFSHETILQAF